MIKTKGVQFPVFGPSKYTPTTPANSEIKTSTRSPGYSNQGSNISFDRQQKSQGVISNDAFLDTSEFNEKKLKLYNDLLVVLENIDLTNSIMNEKGDSEILKTMIMNLNQMENKFDALKRKLKSSGEQELFTFTDDLLKEILKIYKRSNIFTKNRKTAGFYLARKSLSVKCILFF